MTGVQTCALPISATRMAECGITVTATARAAAHRARTTTASRRLRRLRCIAGSPADWDGAIWPVPAARARWGGPAWGESRQWFNVEPLIRRWVIRFRGHARRASAGWCDGSRLNQHSGLGAARGRPVYAGRADGRSHGSMVEPLLRGPRMQRRGHGPARRACNRARERASRREAESEAAARGRTPHGGEPAQSAPAPCAARPRRVTYRREAFYLPDHDGSLKPRGRCDTGCGWPGASIG